MFLKKNWKLILLIIAIITITTTILGVFYLDNIVKLNSNSISKTNFKNYSELKTKIAELNKDKVISDDLSFSRFIGKLQEIENPKITDKERYETLKKAIFYLSISYSDTNNPQIFQFSKFFSSFVKDNFPKDYNKNTFTLQCQDASCADTPQPKEILAINEQIKNSDFAEEIKESIIKDLINIGYLPKENTTAIFENYISYAIQIRNYASFTKTGANVTISDEIYKFLQKEYPEQYKKALDNPGLSKYGIRDFNL